MKKTIRILLPILLALAIILGSAWYLLVYDREFTRDALLWGARFFEEQGSHSVATWFYDRAYDQASDNDSVAVELAQQYQNSGNFTKAEYTLSKAIQDGGGTELYIALCKTYVAQDKLLDAVSLLDNITGSVKDELDTMRPAAPEATPAPGFYSQYISVSITCNEGTLYVNTNGEYPSVVTDAYTEAFQLAEGENAIYAVAVADNGLVSPLSIFGYTVGGVIEEVTFADAAMEAAIRELISAPSDVPLYTNDLWDITEFTVPAEAADYSDLKHMIFLESLTVHNGVSGQLSSLAPLVNLTTLDLAGTSVSQEELEIIGTLLKLKKLVLNDCGLSSVAALSKNTAVTYLDLSNNTIRDISGLSGMTALQELYLQRNVITDLRAISNCTALTKLDASYNTLTSVAPVQNFTALTWLDIRNNSITDISGIAKLTELTNAYAGHNALTDISALAACTKLVELDISSNALTDISALSSLVKLMYLNFSYNQATAIPAFPKSSALVTIDGSNNLITSLDPLSGLEALNNVLMDYNPELVSVEPLANCPVLIKVNVYGTKVTEVDMLKEQSIIVNFDPTQE